MGELIGNLLILGGCVVALVLLGVGFHAGYRQGYRDAQQESSHSIHNLLTKYGAR